MSEVKARRRPGKDPGREAVKTRKPPREKPMGLSRLRRLPDREAKRLAVSILEVLSGLRTPSEAAETIGVSLPRYYLLEARALEGMVSACKKRPLGPGRSPEREIQKLKLKIERLEREGARWQALLRVAQRAVGISAAQSSTKRKAQNGKKRRRRKPTVRALRVVEVLKEEEKAVDESAGASDNERPVKSEKQ